MARISLIVLGAVLVVLSFHPEGMDMRMTFWRSADKILHIAAALTLSISSLVALPRIHAAPIYLGLIAIIGAVELIQMVGPRSADLLDFFMGAFGVSIVALTHLIVVYRSRLNQQTIPSQE